MTADSLLDGLIQRSAPGATADLHGATERSLFDFVACTWAGLPALPRNFAGAGPAALAVAAHLLDRDDVHWEALVHPGAVIWPVALHVGRERDCSREDLARGVAFGHELMVRLGRALGPGHRRFWQPTATVGPAAVAATATFLRGGDAAQIRAAAAHALSIAGGSILGVSEGTPTRLFHRLHAVEAGIAASNFAMAGFNATPKPLEEPRGVLGALTDSPNPEALTTNCPAALEATSPRVAALSGWALAPAAAAAQLGPLQPTVISTISVDAHPGALATTSGDGPSVDSILRSVPYAVALTLVKGSAPLLPQTEIDEAAIALAASVTLTGERTDGSAAIVVALRDGRELSATAWPPGHPLQPVTVDDLRGKWTALCESTDSGRTWNELEVTLTDAWTSDTPTEQVLSLLDERLDETHGG
jgi:2-methylcitrate dehydratase PrpD